MRQYCLLGFFCDGTENPTNPQSSPLLNFSTVKNFLYKTHTLIRLFLTEFIVKVKNLMSFLKNHESWNFLQFLFNPV